MRRRPLDSTDQRCMGSGPVVGSCMLRWLGDRPLVSDRRGHALYGTGAFVVTISAQGAIDFFRDVQGELLDRVAAGFRQAMISAWFKRTMLSSSAIFCVRRHDPILDGFDDIQLACRFAHSVSTREERERCVSHMASEEL